MAMAYCKDLFSVESTSPIIGLIKNSFSLIPSQELAGLYDHVEDWKVKQALFSMKGNKEVGPNGIHASFYQSRWNTSDGSVCKFAKQVFGHYHWEGELNET